jgi:hypothetical protein
MSLNHHADTASSLDRAIEATRRLTAAPHVPPHVVARARNLAASGHTAPRPVEPVATSRAAPLRSGRSRRALLQVALTLALLVGVGVAASLSGLLKPTSAFAAAVEQVRKMSVVRFVSEVNYAGSVSRFTQIQTAAGITRLEMGGDAGVALVDSRAGTMVHLVPAERKAFVSQTGGPDRPDQDLFKCFEAIPPSAGQPQGRERVDGIDTEVFKVTQGGSTQTFWINPATRLPVRMTQQFDMSGSLMTITMKDFEWDPEVDPALLVVAVPEGYARSDLNPAAPAAEKPDAADETAAGINPAGEAAKKPVEADKITAGVADFLRLCSEVDAGRLPDDLSRATVTAIANRLAANPKFADKTDRLGAAAGSLFGVQIGLGMTGEKLHYLGKNRRANDGKGIVAWYTVGKTTTAINDDFSTRTIAPNDVPGLPKAE